MRFDLDELAAPLERLRPEVEQAYASLETDWAAITERLRTLPIPQRVVVELPPWGQNVDRTLEWRKHSGSWRFCLVHTRPPKPGRPNGQGKRSPRPNGQPNVAQPHVEVRPLEQWTGQERMNTLQYVPALFEQAEKQTRAFIRKAGDGCKTTAAA